MSPQAQRILGYPVDQWITEKDFWTKHMHPADSKWAPQFCVSEAAKNRDHDFEYRMIAADGREVWLHDIVSLVRENGRATRFTINPGVSLAITGTLPQAFMRSFISSAKPSRVSILGMTSTNAIKGAGLKK